MKLQNDTVQFIALGFLLPWLPFGFFYFEISEAGYLQTALWVVSVNSVIFGLIAAVVYLFRFRRKL